MRILVRSLLFVALAISFLIAVGMRFGNEDLFLAFSAGRDTLGGFLAQPDRWSFNTAGKIWIDQSWLSHLTFYVSYLFAGELGPVLLKALLLAGCLVVCYLWCTRMRVTPNISLVCLILGTASIAPLLQIRAENFGMLYFILLTGLLSAGLTGWWVPVASVLVFGLWVNSHGSFMLGLVLIGARALAEPLLQLVLGRSGVSGAVSFPGDWKRWGLTFLAAVAVAAFVNPYGPESLLVPFRQLTAAPITTRSGDWVPLIPALFQGRGFLDRLDVWPFVILCFVTISALAAMMISNGSRATFRRLTKDAAPETVFVALVAAVAVLPLAFRFRRMILFAALALVPVCALFLTAFTQWVTERLSAARQGKTAASQAHIPRYIGLLAAVGLVLVLGLKFYESTVIPYKPGNPLRKNRALVSQLMSFDTYSMDVAEFMRTNNLSGRVFVSWGMSNLLLFKYPSVKVFMDCRDQSIYGNEIIETYFDILDSDPGNVDSAVGLLEEYGVELVLLDTGSRDFGFATRLMQTKKWICIYTDEDVILLASVQSPAGRTVLSTGCSHGFSYSRPGVRVFSEAVCSFFTKGSLSPPLLDQLKALARRHPDANLYSLITVGINGGPGCLNSETKKYLAGELSRLSTRDYMVPGGATAVIGSIIRILSILDSDSTACGSHGHMPYKRMMRLWESVLDGLRARYQGY